MSVTYSAATINARLQAVINQIDAGAGNGVLQVGTVAMAQTLASITLAKPSGVAAAGVLTFTVPDAGPVTQSGVTASARIQDSSGNVIVSGLTVGISSAFDIIIGSTTISVGQTLSLISGTIIGN